MTEVYTDIETRLRRLVSTFASAILDGRMNPDCALVVAALVQQHMEDEPAPTVDDVAGITALTDSRVHFAIQHLRGFGLVEECSCSTMGVVRYTLTKRWLNQSGSTGLAP